jgi:nitrogenase molybdenum-iron protein alpha/beta subunit
MSCFFENTLHYSSPAHGDWGVVRIGMLAPESVQLFVCPFACGRHGAIGAMRQGFKDRLSYLYINQSDIINGYDHLIPPAVEEMLSSLPRRPRVFFVFVSCLDDLIGTDHEALLEVLHTAHPDIEFRVCHMNPISLGSKLPPPVSIQNNLYSLLKPAKEKEKAVNSIGNLVAVSPESELHQLLSAEGFLPLRHISQYESFDAYQQMAKSSFNLVLAPAGRLAAQNMERRLGIPDCFLPVSYRLEEIDGDYQNLHRFLAPDQPFPCDFSTLRQQAQREIEETRMLLGSLPLIVDASATARPYGMARALTEYGFTVKRVEAQECVPFDREDREWIETLHPEIEMCQPQHHRAVLFDRRLPESLAIGVDGAYLAGSRYVADLFGDGGMFGYDGVCKLMRLIRNAAAAPSDLEQLINSYGLVV